MDSNNKDLRPKKHDEKSLEKLESKIVFNNNPQHIFVFKKTEKITAALYLITNLISDNEPLKWQIRETTLKLLSEALTIKNIDVHKKQTVSNLTSLLTELSALCRIGYLSEHISEMNYTVLVREFSYLVESVDGLTNEAGDQSSGILSQDFFAVSEAPFSRTVPISRPIAGAIYKGQNISDRNSIKDIINIPKEKDIKKEGRRETILRLLKDGKSFSIKEFSKEIKDCSEKTIQRELLALVQEGVLDKKGERRWSTYSLKS